MTRIKICGLTRPEDISFVNEAEPDYAGFVIHVPGSRRSVSPEEAARLRARVAGKIVPVGVFVDEPLDNVATLLENGVIEMAQLHGSEGEGYIRELRARTGKPVCKAFRADTEQSVRPALHSKADYLLFDHGSGGTGKAFDWQLVSGVKRPFFLAGGLTVENLCTAISTVHPWAVDLSSGVEQAGQKDREKILAAVAAVRRWDL